MVHKELLKYWGFDEEVLIEIENIEYETDREVHIWTINKKFILKAMKNEKEVSNNIMLAKLLAKGKIPTQRVVMTVEGKNFIFFQGRYYTLFEKIQGKVLKNYFDGDFIKRANAIGKALAELHIGLNIITEEAKEKINIWDNDLIAELSGWVKEVLEIYFNEATISPEELETFKNCMREVEENFPKLYKRLPRQVIHRDFHGGNIIFQDETIVGFIDFDISQVNSRVFDICYLLTGALSGEFNIHEKRERWCRFAKEVVIGYESISKLSEDEVASIKYTMYSIEMIMIAYFYKQGYMDIADTNVKMVNYLNTLGDKVWF